MAEKYTCPCCGDKTLAGKYTWEICYICGWKDDTFQFCFFQAGF
jgi:hypothetical protein